MRLRSGGVRKEELKKITRRSPVIVTDSIAREGAALRRSARLSRSPSPALVGPITPGRTPSPARPVPDWATPTQAKKGFDPHSGTAAPQCHVKLRLVSGTHVELLRSAFGGAAQMATLCTGIGRQYIDDLMDKKVGTFGIAALQDVAGKPARMLGFARVKLYTSFAGGDRTTPSSFRVDGRRIGMLDLICSSANCPGLGKLLLFSVIRACKQRFGVDLLMLEATSSAAGYYNLFGFRRYPDACAMASASTADHVRQAQARFKGRRWSTAEMTMEETKDRRTGKIVFSPSLHNVAQVNGRVGGVWYPGYNRGSTDGNMTVVMSLCLGGGGGGSALAAWSPQSATTRDYDGVIQDATLWNPGWREGLNKYLADKKAAEAARKKMERLEALAKMPPRQTRASASRR